MFFNKNNITITYESFTCPDCGSAEERSEVTRVFLKGRYGVVVKDVCEECAEKYKKDPNYITCTDRTLELINGVPSDRWLPEIECDYTEELVENIIKRYFATSKHFGGRTIIGDAYSSEASYDSVALDLAPGNYCCMFWTNQHKCKLTSPDREVYEAHPAYMRVIGIYLNGNIPAQETMTEIATVGTDCGVLGFFNRDTLNKDFGICTQDSLTFKTDSNGHSVYIAVENNQIVAVEIHTSEDSERD